MRKKRKRLAAVPLNDPKQQDQRNLYFYLKDLKKQLISLNKTVDKIIDDSSIEILEEEKNKDAEPFDFFRDELISASNNVGMIDTELIKYLCSDEYHIKKVAKSNAEKAILKSSLISKMDSLSNELLECRYKQGSIIAPRHNGDYLLLKIKEDDGTVHLEFPQSFKFKNIEDNFNLHANRVLKKQTGLTGQGSLQLGWVQPFLEIKETCFIIEIESFDKVKLPNDKKIVGYEIGSLAKLKEYVAENRIIDSLTIATICKIISTNSDNLRIKKKIWS